jgi:hypothetical protein
MELRGVCTSCAIFGALAYVYARWRRSCTQGGGEVVIVVSDSNLYHTEEFGLRGSVVGYLQESWVVVPVYRSTIVAAVNDMRWDVSMTRFMMLLRGEGKTVNILCLLGQNDALESEGRHGGGIVAPWTEEMQEEWTAARHKMERRGMYIVQFLTELARHGGGRVLFVPFFENPAKGSMGPYSTGVATIWAAIEDEVSRCSWVCGTTKKFDVSADEFLDGNHLIETARKRLAAQLVMECGVAWNSISRRKEASVQTCGSSADVE